MGKHTKRFLIVNAGLLALALSCWIACTVLGGTLESQKAAQRWAGEGETPFAQLSAFMTRSDSLGLNEVYTFRQALLAKMTEISLEPPEGGALYADAWSAGETRKIYGEHGSADARITAVGGNYFLFHPLRLLSGSYIAEDDVMDDRVVLDRELAWRLFGGEDLAGMEVTIGDRPFLVAGVVDRDRDFASRRADTGALGLYMSYRAWANLSAGEGAEETPATPPIQCYELVMPQPVQGFAEAFFRESFQLGSGELVNNTERYTPAALWKLLTQFGARSMHLTDVIYPEWENAARCLGDWCALFFALALALAVCPVVTAVVLLLLALLRLRDILAKRVPAAVDRAVQRSRKKRYRKTLGYRGAHEKSK